MHCKNKPIPENGINAECSNLSYIRAILSVAKWMKYCTAHNLR